MIYKISYVIVGGKQPGAVVNQDHVPKQGSRVELGGQMCEVMEITELVPPQNDFAYLHVTCRAIQDEDDAES